MTVVYLASPIDRVEPSAREAIKEARLVLTNLLIGEGVAVFDPASAWTARATALDARIGTFNRAALQGSNGLLAVVDDSRTTGVPFEIGFMVGLGKPVVLYGVSPSPAYSGLVQTRSPRAAVERLVAMAAGATEAESSRALIGSGLSALVGRVGAYMKEKGWVGAGPQRSLGELLALAHSELSEALEEHRNGHADDEVYQGEANGEGVVKPEGVPIELADCIIRIAGLAYERGIDLASALEAKLAYNDTRAWRHGHKAL